MTRQGSLVPKVHPATRAVEPDDPMFLCATPLAGDPEVMLRCVVQEYGWMGWNAGQILGLFRDSGYPALYALWDFYGEDGIRQRIAEALLMCAAFQVRVDVREADEVCGGEEPEEKLIELGIPQWGQHKRQAGCDHAAGL